jgi:NAD(P)-dependent dehydrogenase (short-subunit alcohol dehydrogenase family)
MNILIVGTSRGIGRALKEHLIDQGGHHVWGIARSKQAEHRNFKPIVANAYVEMPMRPLPETLDVLIYCAGSQLPIGPTMGIDPHEWFLGIRDNLFGGLNMVHGAFHKLRNTALPYAKVIMFSGGGATSPRPFLSSYGVAKCALVRLVETLAQEWELMGVPIHINAIAPGCVRTSMTQQIMDLPVELTGSKEKLDAERTMNGNNAAALRDIFGCIDWLISPQGDFVNGKLIAAKWDDWKSDSGRSRISEPDKMVLRRVT